MWIPLGNAQLLLFILLIAWQFLNDLSTHLQAFRPPGEFKRNSNMENHKLQEKNSVSFIFRNIDNFYKHRRSTISGLCAVNSLASLPRLQWHDDVTKWKHFPRYWPFVRGIHRPPVNSPHKCQWRGALMFSLICAGLNDWVNTRKAGDLRRHIAHYDVIVMASWLLRHRSYMHEMNRKRRGGNSLFLCFFDGNVKYQVVWSSYWRLARNVKFRVAPVPGMPGAFSPPPTSKETTS